MAPRAVSTKSNIFSTLLQTYILSSVMLLAMISLAEASVVYVSFTHEHFIERFDTATGLNLDAPGGPGNGTGFYVTSISNPTGLALDRNGNLYAAGLANGVINEIPLLGTISTFASGIADPLGLAFDSGGNLYVVGSGGGPIFGSTITKIAPNGTVTPNWVTGLTNAYGIASDGTNLFTASGGAIVKITPALGGASATLSTYVSAGNFSDADLAFDGADLFAADLLGVFKITPANGGLTGTAAFFASGVGIRFEPGIATDSGVVLESSGGGGPNTISIFGSNGKPVSPFLIRPGRDPFFMTTELIPEPSSWLLIASGLGGLLACCWRQGAAASSSRSRSETGCRRPFGVKQLN